jgi:hypothetical protein
MSSEMAHRDPAFEQNAAVIASLRRRAARASLWFWICLPLLPVGLVVSGVAVLGFATNPASTAWGIVCLVGLALACVGGGGALLMAADRSKYKRSLALAEQANLMGLRFLETPPKEVLEQLRGLRCFGSADRVAGFNWLTGRIGQCDVMAVDYAVAFGVGRATRAQDQTVFAVIAEPERWPDFVVSPKRWHDVLSRFLGGQLIELPDQTEFNHQLALRGADAEAIVSCFTRQVVELCLAEKDRRIETAGPLLVVFRQGRRARPDTYPERIAGVLRLAEALASCR